MEIAAPISPAPVTCKVETETRLVTVLDELGLTQLATSIHGLAPVGAAAVLTETGDPHRFATARALVKHAGLTPREKLSVTFTGRTKLTGQGRPKRRTTLRRAGVAGVRLPDLRHFYASGLIASGCDVVAIQRALGHAKSTSTLTTYAHLWPSAEDRVRDASARLVAEVVGSGEGTVRAGTP